MIILLVEPTYAATITVGSGGCNYNSIQKAIDAAKPRDMIEVESGSYYENVDINKQLIVKGIDTGHGMPIIDAIRIKEENAAVKLSSDNIVLEGFEIINARMDGIEMISGNNSIINNNLTNNYCGIDLNGNDLTANNNIINNNTISNNRIGIIISGSNNNSIMYNKIINNHNECSTNGEEESSPLFPSSEGSCSNGWGISLTGSNANTIGNNDIESNCEGIDLYDSHNNKIISNYLLDNYHSIDFSFGSADSIHNLIENNQIIDCGGDIVGIAFNANDPSEAKHYEKIKMENVINQNKITKIHDAKPPCERQDSNGI